MVHPRRRTLLQNFGAGLALFVAGCTSPGTNNDPPQDSPNGSTSEPEQTGTPCQTPTPSSPTHIYIFNDRPSKQTVAIFVRRDGEMIFQTEVTLKASENEDDKVNLDNGFPNPGTYEIRVDIENGDSIEKSIDIDELRGQAVTIELEQDIKIGVAGVAPRPTATPCP